MAKDKGKTIKSNGSPKTEIIILRNLDYLNINLVFGIFQNPRENI